MTVDAGYEFFDHTADLGLRVHAANRETLVVCAVEGLYAAIGDLAAGEKGPDRSYDLHGDDAAVLLRDLLAELLLVFEHDGCRAVQVDVSEFTTTRLRAGVALAKVDEARSVLHHEVKAVTYHDLALRPIEGGFEAVFILDI